MKTVLFKRRNVQFHKPGNGFTLIELLVVIAIIALLMAIIMPGIKKAKDQTKFVMCATNLHQMGVAFYLYAADNHDRITPGNQPNGVTIWYTEAYGPGQLLTGGYLPLPTSKESAIIFCPADVDRYSAGPMPAGGLQDARWFEGRWGVPGMCVDFGYEFRDSLDGNWTSGWPPGVYNLGETLVIPDSSDCVIKAEGTELQGPANGSAVIVHGMERCRYYFGTIQCNSTNADAAALKIKPTASMPALMSKVTYAGLWGVNKKLGWGVLDNAKETGSGLCIDAELNKVCWNEFSGTHIERVGTGIGVNGGQPCSNNRFWVSFIICVEECICEKGNNVERNTWTVNVEAIKPDSFAVRTGASYGKWLTILGTADWFYRPQDENNQCKSLILDPGAKHNLFEFHPPVEDFAPVVDKSGNNTNVILQTSMPPLSEAAGIQWDGNRP